MYSCDDNFVLCDMHCGTGLPPVQADAWAVCTPHGLTGSFLSWRVPICLFVGTPCHNPKIHGQQSSHLYKWPRVTRLLSLTVRKPECGWSCSWTWCLICGASKKQLPRLESGDGSLMRLYVRTLFCSLTFETTAAVVHCKIYFSRLTLALISLPLLWWISNSVQVFLRGGLIT